MKYQQFLDYIYQRHSGNVKLGLDRMHKILAAMNEPNLKLAGIHIAGTNGKGSTAAMCEALSLQHGITTGLNTSPHLIDYRERFRINGKNIDFTELLTTYRKWEKIFEKNEASFFEITTAMAFYIFHEKNVKNAIFEVGLGGRLDGTKPFSATVSAITSISYDHPKSLGESVEKIAFEKAGIIKEKIPVIIGKMEVAPRNVIKKVAIQKKSPLIIYGKDFWAENIKITEKGTCFDLHSENLSLKNLCTNLIGKHQAYNVSSALMAFQKFMQIKNRKVEERLIRAALQKVDWIGRMQIIARKPTVMIDGAHNEEGVSSLVQNLQELFPDKKILFVLAILRDKNLEKIIKNICQVSSKIFITKNQSKRAAEIEEQVEYVKKFTTEYEICEDVTSAAKQAISETKRDDIVMISGSLYTISEILAHLDELKQTKKSLKRR